MANVRLLRVQMPKGAVERREQEDLYTIYRVKLSRFCLEDPKERLWRKRV